MITNGIHKVLCLSKSFCLISEETYIANNFILHVFFFFLCVTKQV